MKNLALLSKKNLSFALLALAFCSQNLFPMNPENSDNNSLKDTLKKSRKRGGKEKIKEELIKKEERIKQRILEYEYQIKISELKYDMRVLKVQSERLITDQRITIGGLVVLLVGVLMYSFYQGHQKEKKMGEKEAKYKEQIRKISLEILKLYKSLINENAGMNKDLANLILEKLKKLQMLSNPHETESSKKAWCISKMFSSLA